MVLSIYVQIHINVHTKFTALAEKSHHGFLEKEMIIVKSEEFSHEIWKQQKMRKYILVAIIRQ